MFSRLTPSKKDGSSRRNLNLHYNQNSLKSKEYFCPSEKEGTIPKENCKDIVTESNVKSKELKNG